MYKTNTEKSVHRRVRVGARSWVQAVPLEAIVWTVGLAALATLDPHSESLISLCLFDALGVSFCPGCGLGHAVAHLARGHLTASVQAHPLGLPAVLILIGHVGRLVRPSHLFPSLSSSS